MKNSIVTRTKADRLRYVIVFEIFLIAILAPLGAFILNKAIVDVGILSIILSIKAMILGYFYNVYFDQIDARAGRTPTKRSFFGRIVHAAGFEFTLVLTSIPLVMWWLELTLFKAVLMDIVVSSIVVLYTFMFTYCYDWFFPVAQYDSEESIAIG